MQTKYIQYFVDTARLGSISAAAAEDFITPQGMSRSLSSLETDLGCSLFNRIGGQLKLSEYGEALLPDAEKMLGICDDMMESIVRIRTDISEISARDVWLYLNNVAFETALFRPLSESFDQMFSNARYLQCSNEQVVEQLLEHKEDYGRTSVGLLCLFDVNAKENDETIELLNGNGFVYQPYIESYDQVLVSAHSDLATKRSLSRADILSRPIITAPGDIQRVVEKLFGPESIYMVTADSIFRFHAVANDRAISFVPAFNNLVPYADGPVVSVPMREPYRLEIGLAARKGVAESDFIKELFSRLNVSYSRYADSPYLSFVPSKLTTYQAEDDTEGKGDLSLEGFANRHNLSKRESGILFLLGRGCSVADIAEDLGIAESTAKAHIAHVYKKIGVHSHRELLQMLADREADPS